jgi:subtilisin family serine protease
MARSLAASHSTKIHYFYDYGLHGFAATLSPEAAQDLRNNPVVDYVERDRPVYANDVTEPNAGWALGRIDQRYGPSDNSFTYATSGLGVNIYIVDAGVNASHPDFGGRVHAAWTWDSNYPADTDCNGHGTAVASVAAGSQFGVAKAATIWSVRGNDCDTWSWVSTWTAAIDWVTGNHINPAVMNFSYGTTTFLDGILPGSMHNAVIAAKASGVVVVVSAGNDGGDACGQSPANALEVLTVAATDNTDTRASFSDWGHCVDIFAPGVFVDVANYTGGYTQMSGTSFSAPYVAGAAALLRQKYPQDSPDDIQHAIVDGGSASVVHDQGADSPNVLVYSQLPGPVYTSIIGPTYAGPFSSCSWTADVHAGRGPYTYQWSGLLSGNESGISGRISETGGFLLQVWDALGGYATATNIVEFDPNYAGFDCQ